jgi:HEAT repeat protein
MRRRLLVSIIEQIEKWNVLDHTMDSIVRNRFFGTAMPIFASAALVFCAASIAAEPTADVAIVKKLITALDSEKDDGNRLQLVKQLAALKSPKAIATLSVEMNNEKSPTVVRIEALKGLEAIKDADAHDALAITAMKSDSVPVRARAIESIGNLRIREFIPACVRGLTSREPAIRRSSIDALIQFNDMRSAARALAFVEDKDDAVRKSAHVGAGQFALKVSLFVLRLG